MTNQPITFPITILSAHLTHVGSFRLSSGCLAIRDHWDVLLDVPTAVGTWYAAVEKVVVPFSGPTVASVVLLHESLLGYRFTPGWPAATSTIECSGQSIALFDKPIIDHKLAHPANAEYESFIQLWDASVTSAMHPGVNVVKHGCFVACGIGEGAYPIQTYRSPSSEIFGVRVDFRTGAKRTASNETAWHMWDRMRSMLEEGAPST